MSSRNAFLRLLHATGAAAVALLTGLVAVLLHAAGASPMWPGLLAFAALALALEQGLMLLLLRHVLRPTGLAAGVAARVAEGDLGLPQDDASAAGRDPLTRAVVAMLARLRDLVGTIRQHAHEAAAMSQQIAASTQEMSASTQEVASTTGDLTERAGQQALVVRAAAEDAGKILGITQELAAGAGQAAERRMSAASPLHDLN